MKTGSAKRKAGFLGLLLGCSSSTAVAAAIGFSISPSVFTNNYVGRVNLSISNLTPGMTVNVDVYADLNSNGIIDAGDLAIASFQVTDGQVPLVSGVRNLNVPGDDDGLANGQILVQYNYPDAGGGLWAGKFLFRVSDPAGNLTSATQAVTVAQYVYPQAITGRAIIAGTGLPLTNCPLALVGLSSGSHLVTTDTDGNYTVYCLPSEYVVAGFNQQGAVFNQNQIVTVSCGETVTNNLSITNGTFSISGKVTDSVSGAGIPNLQLDAKTPDNLGVIGFTDTNGNYALQVTPDTWNVHPTTGPAAARGYVDQTRTNVVITSASVSGINFALSKPTALIYGTVKDPLGNPVIGVGVSMRDLSNNYHPVGRSFATNGSYSIGVQPDTWTNVAPNNADLALQGFTASSSSNVTLVAGQTTNINFVVTRTNWPSLTNPVHVSSSQFQFLLDGLAGQSYTIQTITNLGSTNWLALLTTNAPCASVYILDSQATNGQRFYRALVVP
ncbi:MAG TPA: carboxypeptidase-like regulatory domain-containing protein [Candidatus Limnocylindrales bacterium]|nr:carboxypeptidase-like regulatory domain-containing protein [Candidatus Limnocylindrales bacterium]